MAFDKEVGIFSKRTTKRLALIYKSFVESDSAENKVPIAAVLYGLT